MARWFRRRRGGGGFEGADDPPRARAPRGREDPPPIPIEAEISEACGKNPISAREAGVPGSGGRDRRTRHWDRGPARREFGGARWRNIRPQQLPKAAAVWGWGRGKEADERETAEGGDDDGVVSGVWMVYFFLALFCFG
jgi:hypothetical protein